VTSRNLNKIEDILPMNSLKQLPKRLHHMDSKQYRFSCTSSSKNAYHRIKDKCVGWNQSSEEDMGTNKRIILEKHRFVAGILINTGTVQTWLPPIKEPEKNNTYSWLPCPSDLDNVQHLPPFPLPTHFFQCPSPSNLPFPTTG
jgi:hypothetical protein